ncbi:PhoP regulatory network YrbL family protein [Pseudoruegeria sp. SHC-113]|uniref:PhoP regulatory network YrbL family protein n=1 Tax=Pseudoruegeria sp. SHC-113 TaxID=2855439 RepID=UPI0021BA9FC9|nr:PhoP regulatory network YrbL family protein [Pseudoruegeria sp. SHC-113]MCT8161246.1 PhoP regulatory network YrbL family protein [Pseudoruegeria sp. SHC-113]
MNRSVTLEETGLLAQGSGRWVYQHPEVENALIKVMKPRRKPPGLSHRLRPIKRRFGEVRTAYKEYEEYLAALARCGTLPDVLPAMWGFVETNLGIGMVVEKISGPEGGVAPSLHRYIEAVGLGEDLVAQCAALLDALEAARVVAFDLTPRNVVVGVDQAGARRLVLVDGLSENTLFRVKSFSERAYTRWFAGKRAEFMEEVGRISRGESAVVPRT